VDKRNKPLVSVIIPVYNCQRYLAEAIESVLAQKYNPLEIIIVDDGSTDGTAELIKNLGADIRYVYQKNKGPATARNRGLAISLGDVVAFLDADDYWPVDKLEIQMKHMENNPEIDVVLGRIQCVGSFTDYEKKIRFENTDNTMINVNLGAGIFKKSVFGRIGPFDETLRHYEDHDWFLRAREQGVRMVILKATTLYYRFHEHNMSRSNYTTKPNIIPILKRSIDRRRKQNRGSVSSLPKFFDFDEHNILP
jgi:glycosyltransferase involved in cell wall biosynthesis